MNNYIIASYYTVNTPYEKVMQDYLLNSINNSNVIDISLLYIKAVENLGSHQLNANYKPQFIYETMLLFSDKDIVFLDADAELLQYPTLFDTLDCDIACHILDWQRWYGHSLGTKELLPGTLYVRNNEKMQAFIKLWAELSKNSYKWDGIILKELLQVSDINFKELPLSYCYIKTLPNGKEPRIKIDNPVIVHNQVSRKYRR